MSNEATAVTNSFVEYINRQPYSLSQWYAGVAADPEYRLFVDHSVNRTGGAWIYSQQCSSSTVAREVEQYFLDQGAKGGPGGGDTTTKYVYAYVITPNTRE